MKYKVYQLQRVNEVITHDDITDNDSSTYDVKLNVIAEYEIKEKQDVIFLCEDIWDACNVDCWDSSWKPGELVIKEKTITYPTSDFQGYCNSDIVIETPDGFYRAESAGWTKVNSLDEAQYRIIYTFGFISWKDIRNKEDFDKNKLDEIIEIVKKEHKEKYGY